MDQQANNVDTTWIRDSLSALLSFPVPPDLIEYICLIKNEKDFTEYFSSLLDFENPEHAKFIVDLRKWLQVEHKASSPTMSTLKNVTNTAPGFEKKKEHPRKKGKSPQSVEKSNLEQEHAQEGGKKQKTKFVNLYSQEGQSKDVVLLKGRHKCNCEASKHALINNCLKCGRIVCEQEGVGPCLFCGNLVCTLKQQLDLLTGSKRAEKLRDHLMKQKISKDDEIAIQKRDRLLEYDKSSERLTKVIDDESDYYSISSAWLSAEDQVRIKQRDAERHAQQHASRRDKKFTLDFTGRSVIEEQPELPIDPLLDPVLNKINQNVNTYGKNNFDESIANPYCPAVKFLEDTSKRKTRDVMVSITQSRIQDRELQEMSDLGMCLSMHQPWASLLTAGIKIHEGRSWYTTHRGILWIAAAAKVPTPADIQLEEKHHREILGNPSSLQFPASYPTGCLIGCVNVVDCLSQEEYQQLYPTGPSKEPFVFICENPRTLPIVFSMKGKHKIFKLEAKVHQAAQKSLKRIAKLHSDKILQE